MARTLVYQLEPHAWPGGLAAMRAHLLVLKYLYVDYVLLNPIFLSQDSKTINPEFGSTSEFDEFIDEAHGIGIKVLMTLFTDEQTNLAWFPNGKIDRNLAKEMRSVADFWLNHREVDGFHLKSIQKINGSDAPNSLFGGRAIEVINSVFPADEAPFLTMDCIDPSLGGLTKYYADSTPIDFVVNTTIKDLIGEDERELECAIKASARHPKCMLSFESADSERIPKKGIPPEDGIWLLFNSQAEGIRLYQGQELGLNTDAMTPLMVDDYKEQFNSPGSYLNLTRTWINRWKHRQYF